MNAAIQYSLLRILVFLAFLLGLWLVGLRQPLLLLLVAATLSAIVSAFALSGMRDRMSEDVADRIERRRLRKAGHHGLDEDAEDAEWSRTTGGTASRDADPDSFR